MHLMPYTLRPTSSLYSPHDQLPAPPPMTTRYLTRHFYENTAKHLIRDTVRIMSNGLHIDLSKVVELEATLDNQLEQVEHQLANNPLIKQFNAIRHRQLTKSFIEDRKTKLRDASHYLKPFNPKDVLHRSYFMTLYANQQGISHPTEEVIPGVPKWSVKLVTKLASTRPVLLRMLNNQLTEAHDLIRQTVHDIADYKASLYNKSYLDQIENPSVPIPPFNPGSSKQKQELFEWLGIEPLAISKDTGLPSWGRDQIEEVNRTSTNPDIVALTQSFIDHSYAAIIRSNFIEAFYNYTVYNRLRGNYRLLGAKSGRYTSNSPNMLNMPSTGSIFAKPIKQCFTAPEGFLIASIDYSALENRVVANLSRDPTMVAMYQNDLDGHCVNSLYYFREEIAEHIELTGDLTTDARNYANQLNTNKALKDIRQKGKGPSFGLQYGAYPPKIANTVKCSLEEAQRIFDRYHYELYKNVTEFREGYVLPSAINDGQVHLGLGFNLQTDNPERDIRTLNNGCSQFWSILTGLTINKLHQLIDLAGYQNDILVTSTIYDSIYFEVRNDPEIIKWLNDTLIPIMELDFMEDQIVHNSANLEIGTSWADLVELPHNAPLDHIANVIKEL